MSVRRARTRGRMRIPGASRQHRQPSGTRAPKQAHQHGLGAIIGMMTGRDDPTGAARGSGSRALERVPLGERGNERREPAPSDWSQAGPRPASCRKGPRAPWRKRAPGELIDRRRAQPVIDAVRFHAHPESRGELGQDVEQRHRVGTARDGHQHDVSASRADPRLAIVRSTSLNRVGGCERSHLASSNALQKIEIRASSPGASDDVARSGNP